ncbi:MAG: gluconate 2-dehydrogenase subunit 3 family protein [Gemmatimonadaceae bacterium]
MTENDTLTQIDVSNELSADLISRREAILRMSVLLGGVALIGSGALISGCKAEKTATVGAPFTPDDIAYLDEIADTILPTTSTPGAKAAKTGAFMALMVTDTYHEDDDKTFREGMRKLDDLSKQKNGGASFMKATPAQRLALLQELDKEQHDYSEKQRADRRKKSDAFISSTAQQNAPEAKINSATQIESEPPNKYFRMMKELALLGYFTSEIGATQALQYVESPGRYDPCVPYKPGDRDWASHA